MDRKAMGKLKRGVKMESSMIISNLRKAVIQMQEGLHEVFGGFSGQEIDLHKIEIIKVRNAVLDFYLSSLDIDEITDEAVFNKAAMALDYKVSGIMIKLMEP